MKKILSLVLVSALGGALTLGAYKLFLEDEQKVVVAQNETPTFLQTSNISGLYNVEEEANFVAAAENTVNAVVHVKNVAVSGGQMSIQDLFFGRTPSPQYRMGTGSGVIVDPTGYIITNNHVIRNSQELSVTLNNNKTYKAEIIGTDPETDIAILKINTDEDLPVVSFGDSDGAKIGEWVLAVGNPFNLTSTVTAGIISAKSRDLTGGQSFIQTDAAVNPGNSGGALVNTQGELIGINTAISSQTGSYVGYSFAVPSNIAKKIYYDIVEYGNIQKGVLGVSILNKSSEEAVELGVNEIEGVYVSEVTHKSGAEKAGIKKGDIIKQLDHIEISKFEDLRGYLKTKRPNDIVNVKVLRDDELLTLPVEISKKDILFVEYMDMEFKDLPNSFKKKFDTPYGVSISKTKNKWFVNRLGITQGYVITKINGIKIKSIEDIAALKEKYGNDYLENLESISFKNPLGDNKEREIIFK